MVVVGFLGRVLVLQIYSYTLTLRPGPDRDQVGVIIGDKWWMVPGGCVSVIVVINVAPFNAIAVSQREIVTDSTVDHNESRERCPGFVGASNLIIHVNCHPAALL